MSADSTELDQEDISAAEAQTLSSIYSFLALTIRYPDATFCNAQLLDTIESLLESLHWQADLTEFRQWRQQTPAYLDDLRTEYTRLFITSIPGTTFPLYASVYLDGARTLNGRTTERTRNFYREHGYDLVDETEPADHLSLELDFLAALAGEAKHDDADRFLRTLFRPWFERFQEKSLKEARHPYFKVSLQLIDFFTKEEQ